VSTALLTLAVDLGPTGLWWTHLLVMVGIYAVLGLSLNLINGYGGMFSLGHHGLFAIGAYVAASVTNAGLGDVPGPLLFLVSAAAGTLAAAAGGLAIGLPCLRLRGDYLAVATLGFAEIVRILIQNLPKGVFGGSEGLNVPRVLMEVTPDTRGDFRLLWAALVIVVVALTALVVRNVVRSARGRALLAVAQDETAAGLLGIDVTRSKVMAFVLGSAGAGLAGALYAHYQGKLLPGDFEFPVMVSILLVVVLGGLGSITGCIVAALVLRYVEQVLQLQGQDDLPLGAIELPAAVGPWLREWWLVVYALILVLLMIFRPHGLFGSRELPDLLRALRRAPRAKGSAA
jgi:branched-chain amino acid transport system permease protein